MKVNDAARARRVDSVNALRFPVNGDIGAASAGQPRPRT
jgi:hypothetical protein